MGRTDTIVASLTGAPQRWHRAAVPRLDVQQPALEARRHRFRAVGVFELQENGGDVLLDRVVKSFPADEVLNDYDYNGRPLRVNASEPKESRPGGGGGGYKGDGGGGGGYKGGGGGYKGGGGGGKGGGGW